MRNQPDSAAIHQSRVRPPATEAADTRKARYAGTYSYGIQSELKTDGCSAPHSPTTPRVTSPARIPPHRQPTTPTPAAKNELTRKTPTLSRTGPTRPGRLAQAAKPKRPGNAVREERLLQRYDHSE